MSGIRQAGLDLFIYPTMPVQPRKEPMKVLCLGLSRTGTMSTYAALKMLGYNPYHAWEMGRDNKNDSYAKWMRAIRAKYYGKPGKKLETDKDFDEILWRYDAVSDTPCILFSDEMLKAYPDAKVILTERPVEGWINSLENSYFGIIKLKLWRLLERIDPQVGRGHIAIIRSSCEVYTGMQLYKDGEPNRDALRKFYAEYNQHIKDIVPKDKLLTFHPKDGWEPLCKHLGKPVPEQDFPKTNEGRSLLDLHAGLFGYARLVIAVSKLILVPGLIAALGWAWTRYSERLAGKLLLVPGLIAALSWVGLRYSDRLSNMVQSASLRG